MEPIIGKIKSLALQDFLTYNELKYIPGDNLNVIIGPNGTGKSTIVAGIILGCGGKPSVLSRSKNITDYIKNGKTKAHIEIELVKNRRGDAIAFHRSFDKHGKESFSIDGAKVTYKAYLERIKKFNIQVDNLCMFLPQDRVQDFTKMNPQELLHNTQISVCSEEINKSFMSLLEKRERQKVVTKKNNNLSTQLADNINRNEQLNAAIESSKLKDELKNKIDLFRKKRTWLEYDELYSKYKEAEDDVKQLQNSINAKRKLLTPLENKQKEVAGTKNELQNAIQTTTAKEREALTEIDRLMQAANSAESEIGRAKQDLKNLMASAKDFEMELKEAELQVQFAKNEHEDVRQELEREGNYEQKLAKLNEEINASKAKTAKIMKDVQAVTAKLEEQTAPAINAAKRRLADMDDGKQQQIHTLRNNFDDTYRAFEWLQHNRQSFNGHIFDPVLLEISVVDNKYAKYVENTIPIRDLQSFLCTDKQDMERLIKKFRHDLKLNVNVGYTEPGDEIMYAPRVDIQQRPRGLGLYAYLIDVIEGPAPVINYLCSLYGLQNIAVGDDRTFQKASLVPDDIKVFFSTNHRFQISISKYSNNKSVASSEIRRRNLLNVGKDQDLYEREENNLRKLIGDAEKLNETRQKMYKEAQNVETTVSGIRNQMNLITAKVKKVKNYAEKLRKKESDLVALKNRQINIPEERLKYKTKVDNLIFKLLKANASVGKALIKYSNLHIQRELARKRFDAFDDSTDNIDRQIENLQRDIRQILDTQSRAKYVSESCKNRVDLKEAEALKLTDGSKPKSSNFKYKSQFQKIPDTIQEIQTSMDEMQGRMECIRGVDEHILVEFEQRKATIIQLQKQLEREHDAAVELENELERLHQIWYPAIQNVVETINQNFSDFFALMGFVGEVELIRKEERDYASYGIQIRVQYRDNEKLQALNRHVQSGGERAVAIAVYTLSLQHSTTVPFRCVDEINQGMDPSNERKIFQMLVDITCQEGQSQYFFVTPKLLPDLPYSDLMCVTVVHNGKYIEDPYVFMDDEAEYLDSDDNQAAASQNNVHDEDDIEMDE